jgi:hypothetical protein
MLDCPVKYQWWGGAKDATREIKNRIKVNDARGGDYADSAEAIEQHSDDDGNKQLEKILDPKMNDPEAPVIDDGEVSGAVIEECRQIEDGDRHRGEEEKNRELTALWVFEGRPYRPKQQRGPEHESCCQPDLPGLTKVEIFPTPISKPLPPATKHLPDTKPFAEQAARDNDDQCCKQEVHTE